MRGEPRTPSPKEAPHKTPDPGPGRTEEADKADQRELPSGGTPHHDARGHKAKRPKQNDPPEVQVVVVVGQRGEDEAQRRRADDEREGLLDTDRSPNTTSS